MQQDDKFLTKMERAKHFVDLQAKRNVVKSIVEEENKDKPQVIKFYNKEKKIIQKNIERISENFRSEFYCRFR